MNKNSHSLDYQNLLTETLKSIRSDIRIDQLRANGFNPSSHADASVEIEGELVLIEVKSNLHPSQIIALRDRFKPEPSVLIISEYITPKSKKLLIENKLNYLDGVGNIHLELKNLTIHHEGIKNTLYSDKNKERAFTKNGAKVLFQLLMEPEAINITQRDLASRAEVSLGMVHKVLYQLRKENYVLKKNSSTWMISRHEDLIERWVNTLREKKLTTDLPSQRFRTIERSAFEFLRNEPLGPEEKWGGEAGAALLTEYLVPEQFVLYSRLHKSEVMRRYRLVPDENGDISVREPFWSYISPDFADKSHIHPLLIYAELITMTDSRALETANMIYDEYIRPLL